MSCCEVCGPDESFAVLEAVVGVVCHLDVWLVDPGDVGAEGSFIEPDAEGAVFDGVGEEIGGVFQ